MSTVSRAPGGDDWSCALSGGIRTPPLVHRPAAPLSVGAGSSIPGAGERPAAHLSDGMPGTTAVSMGMREAVLSGMGLPPAGSASSTKGGGPLRATGTTASLDTPLHSSTQQPPSQHRRLPRQPGDSSVRATSPLKSVLRCICDDRKLVRDCLAPQPPPTRCNMAEPKTVHPLDGTPADRLACILQQRYAATPALTALVTGQLSLQGGVGNPVGQPPPTCHRTAANSTTVSVFLPRVVESALPGTHTWTLGDLGRPGIDRTGGSRPQRGWIERVAWRCGV